MADTDFITFESLNVSPWLIEQLKLIGIKNPTPIQSNCIPEILKGRDCVGAAKTGSGKTLAFVLPILQKLSEDPYGIYALILTPTRELAFQIADQFAVLGKPLNLRHTVIVGGMDIVQQWQALEKKPHVVIATPGRLCDHLESHPEFKLSRIKFLVLDEADRLLGGQFDEQIKTIFPCLPKGKRKQNLFFSATITDTLNILKEVTGNDVFEFEATKEATTVEGLDQHYVLVPVDVRDGYFVEVIRTFRGENENGNIMVFTDSSKKCQILSMMLNEVGFENVALHGMMPQSQRLASLAKFKSNTVKILLATDVASRGLDIPTVQLVINHKVPKIPKEYLHRVGRTARAGRKGKAITLLSPYDVPFIQNIEKFIGCQLTEYKVDDSEVGKIFTQISVAKSEAHITLDEKDFYEKQRINRRKRWILAGLDPDLMEEEMLKERKKELRRKERKRKRLINESKQNAKKGKGVNVSHIDNIR